MNQTSVGLLFNLFGLASIIFHRPLGREAERSKHIFGAFYRPKPTEKINQIGFLIAGICFVIFGVLVVLRIIRFPGDY